MTTDDRMNRISRTLVELAQALDDIDREHKTNVAIFNDRMYVLSERTRALEEQGRALEERSRAQDQEQARVSQTIRGLINSVSELQADVERIGNA